MLNSLFVIELHYSTIFHKNQINHIMQNIPIAPRGSHRSQSMGWGLPNLHKHSNHLRNPAKG